MGDILRKGDTAVGPDGLSQNQAAGGGSGTPGGSNTQVQYNNAGSFGGITGATSNGTALTLVAPVLGTPASGTLTNCTGLPVAGGGTGAATLTDGGVLVGNGTGAVQVTAVGTAGHVLTSNGAGSDPTFQAAAGGIGGSTGATDNAILAADGAGGSTLQARNAAIDDSGQASFGTTTPAAQLHALQATLGNVVLRLASTATNDDPIEDFIQGRVATTDATPTNMITIPIPANTIVALEGRCVARRTGGASGTAEDGAFYHIEAVFQNIAGVATLITSVSSVTARESQAAWNCTFATSGSDVFMRVTGAANNDVTWHGHLRKMAVSS